jgi:uncharacterized membrane protein
MSEMSEMSEFKKNLRPGLLRRFLGLSAALVLTLTARAADAQEVPVNKDVVIPLGEVTSTAKFFPVEIDGTRMEVLAIKAPDGSVRTAFNTCQVCYASGRGYYKQIGSVLVCQNCGNRFPANRIEVQSGGCNPVPIFAANKIVSAENITIPVDFLRKIKGIFANWKR